MLDSPISQEKPCLSLNRLDFCRRVNGGDEYGKVIKDRET